MTFEEEFRNHPSDRERLDEGLWGALKGAWQGMRQGASTGWQQPGLPTQAAQGFQNWRQGQGALEKQVRQGPNPFAQQPPQKQQVGGKPPQKGPGNLPTPMWVQANQRRQATLVGPPQGFQQSLQPFRDALKKVEPLVKGMAQLAPQSNSLKSLNQAWTKMVQSYMALANMAGVKPPAATPAPQQPTRS